MSKPPSTPRGLCTEARRMWAALRDEYGVTDSAGLRLLQVACESLTQLRAAEAVIKKDGMTVTDRYGGVRGHPMLAVIRDGRAAMLKAMKDLNLDIEPLRDRPGRPPERA